MLPVILISAPPGDRDESVEIISASNGGVSWLAQDGGTVIVRSPSGGGHLLVAAYGPPEQVPDLPRVQVRRLDRSRPHDATLGSMDFCRERGEVQTELVGIWEQANQQEARIHLAAFKAKYAQRYPEAVRSLMEDEEHLLTFYEFPATLHRYLQTTNAIESLFSNVRQRTDQIDVFTTETSCLTIVWATIQDIRLHKISG